jgi:hypothetical protein
MTVWTNAFYIRDSKNIHFNDINFDYETSSSVTGTVIAADAPSRTITLLIDDEFDMSDGRYTGGKIKWGNYIEYTVDEKTGEYYPNPNGNLCYNSEGDNRHMISNGTYIAATKRLTLSFAVGEYTHGPFKTPDTGTVACATYTMYEYHTFIVEKCEDYYMESCNIYMSLGMMLRMLSTKNIYLNRTNMMLKPGSKRLITTTADGLHTIDCYGDLIVTNSIYEASHDDAMNICTFYFKVVSAYRNTMTCAATKTELKTPINTGDTLEIFNKNTMESVAVRTVTDSVAIGTSYDLTLDRNLPAGINYTDFIVANITRVPRTKIDNCIVRNKRNRGILVQMRDSVITNCAFYNVLHGTLLIFGAQDVFAEGVIPKNITVENNKFFRNLSPDINVVFYGAGSAPGVINGIVARNNLFCQTGYASVHYLCAGDGEVSNNLFYEPGRVQRNNGPFVAVTLNTSKNIRVRDNLTLVSPSERAFENVRQEVNATEGMIIENNLVESLA